ncbi:MAG: flagellar hook-basal body complex protein FliE [Pseudomonadota bacterium]
MQVKPTEMQRILADLRSLQSAVQRLETTPVPNGSESPFAKTLSDSLAQVNRSMLSAQEKADAFVREEPGVSLVDAMVAMNEAQVSFRYVVEVRNRLIQAYQDIANMPM